MTHPQAIVKNNTTKARLTTTIIVITWFMSLPGLEEGRRMTFWVEIGLYLFYALVRRAVLVLESSRDGKSTLT